MNKKQVKKYILINSNFNNIAEVKLLWKYFVKSHYYKNILEENNFNNVDYYCDKFLLDIRHLNLIN